VPGTNFRKKRAWHEFRGKACLARISGKSVPGTNFYFATLMTSGSM
jgi:hypothetical protein